MDARNLVDLAGFDVAYSADTDEQLDRLQWFFGNLPPASGPCALEVRLGYRTTSPPTDSGPATRHGPTRRWDRADGVAISHDLGARADITDQTLQIECPPDLDDQWRAERHLLFSGLSWWLERHDLIMLHAAMLARGSDATLILGDTGSGKSTAAFAGRQRGWDLCSDDLVIVGQRDGRLQGFGIPKPPSIDADIARSSGLQGTSLPGDERDRVVLAAEAMATGWRSLRMILVVGHHADQGSIEPLSHAETMDVAMLACLEADRPDVVGRHLRTIALLASTPGYELLHAADPTRRVGRAAELIESAWSTSTTADRDQ